jgi:hypothetical protein
MKVLMEQGIVDEHGVPTARRHLTPPPVSQQGELSLGESIDNRIRAEWEKTVMNVIPDIMGPKTSKVIRPWVSGISMEAITAMKGQSSNLFYKPMQNTDANWKKFTGEVAIKNGILLSEKKDGWRVTIQRRPGGRIDAFTTYNKMQMNWLAYRIPPCIHEAVTKHNATFSITGELYVTADPAVSGLEAKKFPMPSEWDDPRQNWPNVGHATMRAFFGDFLSSKRADALKNAGYQLVFSPHSLDEFNEFDILKSPLNPEQSLRLAAEILSRKPGPRLQGVVVPPSFVVINFAPGGWTNGSDDWIRPNTIMGHVRGQIEEKISVEEGFVAVINKQKPSIFTEKWSGKLRSPDAIKIKPRMTISCMASLPIGDFIQLYAKTKKHVGGKWICNIPTKQAEALMIRFGTVVAVEVADVWVGGATADLEVSGVKYCRGSECIEASRFTWDSDFVPKDEDEKMILAEIKAARPTRWKGEGPPPPKAIDLENLSLREDISFLEWIALRSVRHIRVCTLALFRIQAAVTAAKEAEKAAKVTPAKRKAF